MLNCNLLLTSGFQIFYGTLIIAMENPIFFLIQNVIFMSNYFYLMPLQKKKKKNFRIMRLFSAVLTSFCWFFLSTSSLVRPTLNLTVRANFCLSYKHCVLYCFFCLIVVKCIRNGNLFELHFRRLVGCSFFTSEEE